MSLLIFGTGGQVSCALADRSDAITAQFGGFQALSRRDADLNDPEACAAWINKTTPRAVINAAAYTAVDAAETDEETATIINGDTVGAMARACAAQDIPFVHYSTDYVFPGAGTTAFQPDDPTGPLNAYGRSKLAGEDAVRAAGGRFAILRTSWVYSGVGKNFVGTMLKLAQTRDALTIVADQIGGPTPATALADAGITAAAKLEDGIAGGTFHLSGAPDVSWADFARAIFDVSGQSVNVEDVPSESFPTPAARPRNSRLDCTSLMDRFGIARPDWKATLPQIVAALHHGKGT